MPPGRSPPRPSHSARARGSHLRRQPAGPLSGATQGRWNDLICVVCRLAASQCATTAPVRARRSRKNRRPTEQLMHFCACNSAAEIRMPCLITTITSPISYDLTPNICGLPDRQTTGDRERECHSGNLDIPFLIKYLKALAPSPNKMGSATSSHARSGFAIKATLTAGFRPPTGCWFESPAAAHPWRV